MKKLIVTLLVSLYSLCTYAIPSLDLDGITASNLNSFSGNQLQVYGHSSGTYSAGICRIIIRSNTGDYLENYNKLAQRFKFIFGSMGQETEVTPVITFYALMFKLTKHTDFSNEYIIIETKDGKSIGENINAIFGGKNISVLAGTCYSNNAKDSK